MTQPVLPLTYPESVCVDDFDLFDRTVGSDYESLQQDVYHRLIEAPGSNPDDETLGIGIEQLLSGTSLDLAAAAHRIESELLKDDRITACTTSVMLQSDLSYLLVIEIEVSAVTLGLQYAFSAGDGLQPVSS